MPKRPPTHKPPGYRTASERKRQADTRRGSSTQRGYGYAWQKRREAFLKENPLCAHCQAKGLIQIANEVDHIRPHRGDMGVFWQHDNLQSLCKPCHSLKTWRENLETADFLPKYLPKSRIPLTIISGPPGSGKTTYAKKNAGVNGIIIDLDEITSRLSGQPWYQSDSKWLRPAIEERNRILTNLSSDTAHDRAWFIAGAAKKEHRQHWADMLGAERVIVLATPPDVCIKRIKVDERRTGHEKRFEHAVYKWWQDFSPRDGDEIIKK